MNKKGKTSKSEIFLIMAQKMHLRPQGLGALMLYLTTKLAHSSSNIPRKNTI